MGDPQPLRAVMAADRLLLTPEEARKFSAWVARRCTPS